jgi:GNAT superfamily N-acetyltransferase
MKVQELDSTLIMLEYLNDEYLEDYNPQHVLNTVRDYNIKADHIWFNAYEGGRVVGAIGAYVYEDNWTKVLKAHVQYFYILPSHRNHSLCKELLKEVEIWAKDIGCCELTASVEGEYFNKALEQLGLGKQVHYVKDL